jgi:hypothetical protein
LNGVELTVIGVAPPDFTGLDQYTRFEFYAPLMMWPQLVPDATRRPLEAREYRDLTVKGRLEAGVTLSQAQGELTAIATALERAYPDTDRNRRLILRTELGTRIAQAPPIAALAAMLIALAGAVLVVACANVAGLLASRSPTRAREVAMRLAIGAGRGRVVRQLVTESLLIAALGGIAGLGVAYAGVTLFRQVRIPTELPIAATFEIDGRVLLVSFGAALISAVIFGVTPALRSTRTDLTAVLKGMSLGRFRAAALGTGAARRRASRDRSRSPRRRHVHLQRVRATPQHRPRIPHRSAVDALGGPGGRRVRGGADAAVLRTARRPRPALAGREVGGSHLLHAARRNTAHASARARGISIPGGRRVGVGPGVGR